MSHNLNQDCWEKFKKLRYVDDNILRTENEEELKSLLMRVREISMEKLAWNLMLKKLSLHGKEKQKKWKQW